MGTKRKTITLTDTQDNWIKRQINARGFTNDSEYIRDLIRRDQTNHADIEVIRAALVEGEESGEPKPSIFGYWLLRRRNQLVMIG